MYILKNLYLFLVTGLLLISSCQKDIPLELSKEEIIVEYDVPFITLNTSGIRFCETMYIDNEGKKEIGHIYISKGENRYKGEWYEVIVADHGKYIIIKLDINLSGFDRVLTLSLDDADIYNRCTLLQKRK